jgi:bifunctional non-homologous end joining protein LigD
VLNIFPSPDRCLSGTVFYYLAAFQMGLSKYIQKRDFSSSPEPKGGKANRSQLRFVVQKHAASHLHYDFRLEMEGVLKSWAVPKGPSTDPKVKRLAMMVEDHPYDYRNFEGIIPSGYGAGTVIVWDEGLYLPAVPGLEDKKSRDNELRKMLHAGKIHFVMMGKKLKGEYALIKSKNRGENAWLLFKVNDQYASDKDVLLKDKSVISDKTLEQIERTTTTFYGKGKVNKEKAEEIRKKRTRKNIPKTESKKQVKKKPATKTSATKQKKNRQSAG